MEKTLDAIAKRHLLHMERTIKGAMTLDNQRNFPLPLYYEISKFRRVGNQNIWLFRFQQDF